MRILIMIVLPCALLGACNVTKDEANNTVSVTYNEEVAANTAADVTNTAQNIAADIGNEAKSTADKVNNSDISVNVNRNEKTENKQ
jgi:hypothetical protein